MLTRAGFELDGSTGRAVDRYPKGANSNPARVNGFQLTSAVSDYHVKLLFMYHYCIFPHLGKMIRIPDNSR